MNAGEKKETEAKGKKWTSRNNEVDLILPFWYAQLPAYIDYIGYINVNNYKKYPFEFSQR